jgi:hypothetical protein
MRDVYSAGIGGITCSQVHGIRSERPTFLYSTRPIHHWPPALKREVVCPEERRDEIIRLIARRVCRIAVTALSPPSTWDKVQRIREIEASL